MNETVVIRSRLGDKITSTMHYSERLNRVVEHIEISAANVSLPGPAIIDNDFDIFELLGVSK